MPRQKSNITKAVFNTTIKVEIFTKFRDYCNEINYPMSTIMEAFMDVFGDGKVQLGFDDENHLIIKGMKTDKE